MADTAIKDLVDADGNPTEITLSYNGVVFGPLVKFHLEAAPEYDPTRRVTVHERYRLSIVSWEHAASESAMSSDLEERREKLLQPGGRLKISQVGFGTIDTGTSTPDLAWGPHPQQATFTMLGGAVMWQLEWSCEFQLNHCASPGLVRSSGRPLSFFSYDVAYSHDDLGFTTRAIQAVLKIPQIKNGKQVSDIPENYRHRLQVAVPPGYRRVRYDLHSNPAQDELRITIVDQQLHTEPFPPGIANADVRLAVTSQNAMTNVVLGFTISGEMETVPGVSKSLAQIRFFQIAFSRIDVLRRAIGRGAIIPTRIDMSHSPYGRRSSFSFGFRVTVGDGGDKGAIFNPRLLYEPLPKTSWQEWVDFNQNGNSLRSLWGPNGQTALHTSTPGLIDQCNPTHGVTLNSSGAEFSLGGYQSDALPSSYFTCKDLKPEDSWLFYEVMTEFSRNENISRFKRDAYVEIPFLDKQSVFGSTSRPSLGASYADVGDVVVRRGTPDELVVVKGKALRIRYPVDVAMYKSVEGVGLTLLHQKNEPVAGPSIFGCPTTFARWIQVYRANGSISSAVRAMPHPRLESV